MVAESPRQRSGWLPSARVKQRRGTGPYAAPGHAVSCELLLELTVAVIVAVVPAVTVTPNVITALLPLALTVVPEGIFQSIKLAGIVIPLGSPTRHTPESQQ